VLIAENPNVRVRVGADRFVARVHALSGEEKAFLTTVKQFN
jgi:hypothetical protein